MAERHTPDVPDSTVAMKAPDGSDAVVVYDKEMKRNGKSAWIQGETMDPNDGAKTLKG